MLMKDANILRERYERRLREIPDPDGIVAQCVRSFIEAIDDLPEIEVKSADEYESLLRRFRHLMQSDYIAIFDAVNSKGEYVQDIAQAGKMIKSSAHGDWVLIGATLNGVSKWQCTCCGFIVRVEGMRRPMTKSCPACAAIIDGCTYEPNYSPFDGNAMTQAEYFGLKDGGDEK